MAFCENSELTAPALEMSACQEHKMISFCWNIPGPLDFGSYFIILYICAFRDYINSRWIIGLEIAW